jgi:hypothetical protein
MEMVDRISSQYYLLNAFRRIANHLLHNRQWSGDSADGECGLRQAFSGLGIAAIPL